MAELIFPLPPFVPSGHDPGQVVPNELGPLPEGILPQALIQRQLIGMESAACPTPTALPTLTSAGERGEVMLVMPFRPKRVRIGQKSE